MSVAWLLLQQLSGWAQWELTQVYWDGRRAPEKFMQLSGEVVVPKGFGSYSLNNLLKNICIQIMLFFFFNFNMVNIRWNYRHQSEISRVYLLLIFRNCTTRPDLHLKHHDLEISCCYVLVKNTVWMGEFQSVLMPGVDTESTFPHAGSLYIHIHVI